MATRGDSALANCGDLTLALAVADLATAPVNARLDSLARVSCLRCMGLSRKLSCSNSAAISSNESVGAFWGGTENEPAFTGLQTVQNRSRFGG